MIINPSLGRVDRIGSVLIGVGLAAYALLGDLEEPWQRAVSVGLGVVLVIGGLCGT